jgi:hypothetical protein
MIRRDLADLVRGLDLLGQPGTARLPFAMHDARTDDEVLACSGRAYIGGALLGLAIVAAVFVTVLCVTP